MKRISVIIVLLFAFSSCDTDGVNDVPSVVENTLKGRFPNLTTVDWEKEDKMYEAEFKHEGRSYTVAIDTMGRINRVLEEIKDSMLPALIRDSLTARFGDYKIDDVEWLEYGGSKYIQVEVKTGGKKHELVLDSLGVIQQGIGYWD